MNFSGATELGLLLFLGAVLYSSVGHGGASAYLALMGLWGIGVVDMKPIALVLNIFVAGIATYCFFRNNYLRWELIWPLILSSVPMAFFGGYLKLNAETTKIIIAVALLMTSLRMLLPSKGGEEHKCHVSKGGLIALGAVIGWVSGMVGIGGGIFLTPILILMNWTNAKSAAGISAVFIFVNSCAGLVGNLSNHGEVPQMTWILLPFVIAGGLLGAYWGSGFARSQTLRRTLACVLFIAAGKFLII